MLVWKNRFVFIQQKRPKVQALTKPTTAEFELAKTTLLNTDARLCFVCLEEDDHSDEEQVQQWLQCSECNIWLHLSCISAPINKDEHYICQ